jgi:putative ubiquitin-RnfH superfamily antitoxin RatB of RatAB toxin-antitoxin module
MKVAVAFSPGAGIAMEWSVELPETATAVDAIRASGILERFPEIDIEGSTLGVWGRACGLQTPLRAGDRVEIYRPLTMDPNEARRLRAKQLRKQKRA